MTRHPLLWTVPWRIVHTLRKAGLRPTPNDRTGCAWIDPQPAQKSRAHIRGVLYWIPRWDSDGRALYLSRDDHWDRAATADVVRSADALTVAKVQDAVNTAIRLAALHDLACLGGDEERRTYERVDALESNTHRPRKPKET